MLQRTLPAFIAPCLPTKTDRLPSGSQSSLAAVIGLCAPADRVASRYPLIVEAVDRLKVRS
jgi:hypothetical protein